MFTDDQSWVFVTLVHHDRQPLSRDRSDKKRLMAVMRDVKDKYHLRVAGYALLDDHLHWLFTSDRAVPAAVVNDLKAQYARIYRKKHPELESAPLWNGGFKFQDVEGQTELLGLLDLMHYDPVRHGYVSRPMDYEWTSLPARVRQGHYPEDWGSDAPPARLKSISLLRRLGLNGQMMASLVSRTFAMPQMGV